MKVMPNGLLRWVCMKCLNLMMTGLLRWRRLQVMKVVRDGCLLTTRSPVIRRVRLGSTDCMSESVRLTRVNVVLVAMRPLLIMITALRLRVMAGQCPRNLGFRN